MDLRLRTSLASDARTVFTWRSLPFVGFFAQVRVCRYCGGQNGDDAASCSGCGTVLSSPELPPAPVPESSPGVPPPLPVLPSPPPLPRILQARTATIVLASFFGAQMAAAMIAGFLVGLIAGIA